MFDFDMATSYLGGSAMTMSPATTIPKSQSNSPMSPMTPSKKDSIVTVSTTTAADMFNARCKRKINFTQLGIPPRGHQPATVARRNARERNRVKQVNNGFAALKQHIPLGHRSKKMSKVETLKCAVEYIKKLKCMLDPDADASSTSSQSSQDAFTTLLQQSFDMSGGMGHSHYNQLSPTSSEDQSSPSYASEASYVFSTGAMTYDCENYEPVSPEDDELLDAIYGWQQS